MRFFELIVLTLTVSVIHLAGSFDARAQSEGLSVGSRDLDAIWWAYNQNPIKARRDYQGKAFSEVVKFDSAVSITSGGYGVYFKTSAPTHAVTCFLNYRDAQDILADLNVGSRVLIQGNISGTSLHDVTLSGCRFSNQ
jgi:hypothetical protein